MGVFLIGGCSQNNNLAQPETLKADKIIFGAIYGMCDGDCRNLYLINNKGLYKDADDKSNEYGNWQSTSFNNENISKAEFENAENLLNIPSNILEKEKSASIEVQMLADFDYYLYIEKDGKSRELIFDHIHKNASPEIKSYFKTFLKSYEELGNSTIDTTRVENYY